MATIGKAEDRMILTWCVLLSAASPCQKMQYGAFLVTTGGRQIGGINGKLVGPADEEIPVSCGTCLRKDVPSGTQHELCYGVHAEQVAMIRTLNLGESCLGGTMYIAGLYAGTTKRFINKVPGFYCTTCARLMRAAGIATVVVPVALKWAIDQGLGPFDMSICPADDWIPVRLTIEEAYASAFAVATGKMDAEGNVL